MTTVFVFPGQGSQSLGMMKGWTNTPIVKATFDEASTLLGQDLWAMCAEDGQLDAINATVNTQPLMLVAGVATYRAWLAAGGAKPFAMAGHSLGEYTALVAADALSFADAVKLVRLRAEAMQSAVPEGVGAMAAILGMDDAALQAVLVQQSQGQVLEAVNFNSAGQTVIAGDKAAVERAIEACKEAGAKRALLLPVSVPSHCSLMRPAAIVLAQALEACTINTPVIPVLQNADVVSYTDPSAIKDALVRQLYSPVRWVETIQAFAAQGVTRTVEVGPGKVLAGLNKRINSQLQHGTLVDEVSLTALLSV